MTREGNQSALVARHAREQLPSSLARLGEYLSIPAISSDKAHHADVLRLSQKLQRELIALGLATLVASTIIVGYGNYLKATPGGH